MSLVHVATGCVEFMSSSWKSVCCIILINISDFRLNIEKLKNIIRSGLDNVSNELLEKTDRNIERVLTAVADAKRELEEAKGKANITEKYWDKVEAARKFFEVSSLLNIQNAEFV
jgi:hypothetical protein